MAPHPNRMVTEAKGIRSVRSCRVPLHLRAPRSCVTCLSQRDGDSTSITPSLTPLVPTQCSDWVGVVGGAGRPVVGSVVTSRPPPSPFTSDSSRHVLPLTDAALLFPLSFYSAVQEK